MSKLTLTKKFVPYPEKQDELRQLANDYKDLVVTEETFGEAKKARKALRDERYSLQNIEKANNAILNDLKGKNKSLAQELIGIIRPVEDKIDEQIKSIEKKKAEEKAEKERKKQEQMAAWAKKAQDILSYTDRLVNPKGIVDVQNIIKEVESIEINENLFGAYTLIAEQNKAKVLEQSKTVLERLQRAEEEKKAEEERKYQEAVEAYKDYFGEEAPKELSTHGILKAIEQDKKEKLARLAELEKKNQEARQEKPAEVTEQDIDIVLPKKQDDYVLSLAHRMINLHPDMTLDEALKIDPKTMEAVIKRKTSLLDAIYELGDIVSRLKGINGTRDAVGHIQMAINNLQEL